MDVNFKPGFYLVDNTKIEGYPGLQRADVPTPSVFVYAERGGRSRGGHHLIRYWCINSPDNIKVRRCTVEFWASNMKPRLQDTQESLVRIIKGTDWKWWLTRATPDEEVPF